MHHFIDLDDSQKVLRRQWLNEYAFIAQTSCLIPLVLLQSGFLISWLRRRWDKRKDDRAPSSPYLKDEKLGHSGEYKDLEVNLRRFRWWLGDEVVVGGTKYGTNGEVLLTLIWSVWLVFLCFVETGDDYLHLTKRFGIVAASQLPFHYLLALKTPYSPLHLLTRATHETLNIYHQLLGRVITCLLYVHAILYINFYVQKDLLASKVQEAYVIAGIVGILAFTAVGTTALAPVRQWSYRVFYITHVVLATALLPVLFFHVSHIRVYLYETAVVYALNVVLRALNSTKANATITQLPGSDIMEIRIPLTQTLRAHNYQPAQHAYLSLPGHPASRTFRSSPFTIASVPTTDNSLRLYARIMNGNTADLARYASTSYEGQQKLTLEGPYGLSTHSEQLLHYDRILFVAGGIGGTFIVPLYRQLLADLSPSPGSYRRQRVEFVWSVKSVEEMLWALPEEEGERLGIIERMKVFVSGGFSPSVNGLSSMGIPTTGRHDDEGGEVIELEERKNLLTAHYGPSSSKISGLQTRPGRPDLGGIVDAMFSHSPSERVAVFVCGPESLRSSLRKEVGKWVMGSHGNGGKVTTGGREMWFWDEGFGL